MPEEDRGRQPDLKKLFEVWMDNETKLMITVFYRNNPGVVETLEGLSVRLGTTVEELREAIADHVSIGLLKEKKIGEKVVLVYDRDMRQDMETFIAEEIKTRMDASASSEKSVKEDDAE